MPDLSFRIERSEVTPFAAVPTLTFRLRIRNAVADERVHSVVLRCQARLDPGKRHYTDEEQAGLRDLFGEPSRWGQTLRGMLWTHVESSVPAFEGETETDLPVPCTFDFNVAATKYFHALRDGEVPLLFLFSGTIFHEDAEGALRVALVPWEKEAPFRLPVKLWGQMMDHYYPNTAWLSLRRDVFDRLHRYKIERGAPTWERALELLLDRAGEGRP
jgi:hypothetical protein